MKELWRTFGLCLWWAGLCGQAAVLQIAPNGLPMHWNFATYDVDLQPDQNPSTLAIRYHLSAQGWSSTNTAAELNAVRAAFAQWQAVSGTKLKFEEGAMVSGLTDVDTSDFQNTFVWLPGNRFINRNATFFPSGAAGVTVLSGSATDEIIAEADIVLNSSREWFTDFNLAKTEGQFIETVALHEIGHMIGFNHSPVGGSTMFWFGPQGIGAQTGLSSDDIAGVRATYGTGSFATLKGTVTMNGAPVLGANVTLEGTNGLVLAGTVTQANGSYTLAGLPSGAGTVRVTALDPPDSQDTYLVRGIDLDPYTSAYNNAATSFLPATNLPVTLAAGTITTKNVAVTAGAPPFRITETRQFLTESARQSGDICIQVTPGQSNLWVGVYIPTLPAGPVTLR
ncbi:MAG TPA: matrixin family metalloprotease, partial [Candidatus Limnocylindria bacterium]|nr:matrixin family metalloprotease [Candidatus Limnocylindria bacterium]